LCLHWSTARVWEVSDRYRVYGRHRDGRRLQSVRLTDSADVTGLLNDPVELDDALGASFHREKTVDSIGGSLAEHNLASLPAVSKRLLDGRDVVDLRV
jgi:hypothetical protein